MLMIILKEYKNRHLCLNVQWYCESYKLKRRSLPSDFVFICIGHELFLFCLSYMKHGERFEILLIWQNSVLLYIEIILFYIIIHIFNYIICVWLMSANACCVILFHCYTYPMFFECLQRYTFINDRSLFKMVHM